MWGHSLVGQREVRGCRSPERALGAVRLPRRAKVGCDLGVGEDRRQFLE